MHTFKQTLVSYLLIVPHLSTITFPHSLFAETRLLTYPYMLLLHVRYSSMYQTYHCTLLIHSSYLFMYSVPNYSSTHLTNLHTLLIYTPYLCINLTYTSTLLMYLIKMYIVFSFTIQIYIHEPYLRGAPKTYTPITMHPKQQFFMIN